MGKIKIKNTFQQKRYLLTHKWLPVVQPPAYRCLFSKTSMDPTSLIVPGRSLKSGLTTREATTGLETTDSVNWHSAVLTSWDLSCSYVTTAGTGPNTAGSLLLESQATTRFTCLATRVTPATMHLATTTEWCSPRTTETTTRGPTADTTKTAQCTTAEDSGTRRAAIATSTLSVVVEMTSDGTHRGLEVCYCVHLACGSRARSLHGWRKFQRPSFYMSGTNYHVTSRLHLPHRVWQVSEDSSF